MLRNIKLFSAIGCFLGLALLAFLTMDMNDNYEPLNNESPEKKQWEFEMLRDPSTGKIPDGVRYKELAFANHLPQKNYKRGQEWRLRGPWNVGGRTRGMAIDVLDEQHMIAGAVSGGIWQTKDGGANWQKVSVPNAHPGVASVAQDTRSGYENIWYALSGEIYGASQSGTGAFYLGDGAFRSLDNGNTWQPLGSTAGGTPDAFTTNFQGGWRIVTSAIDGAVYMACYGSVYRSTDTGTSWTAVLGNGNNSYFTDVAVSETGVVYAILSSGGNTKGFYRSADGLTFENITPTYLSGYDRTVIEIDPNNENTVYFLSELNCINCGGVTSANYQGVEEYVSLQRYNYISGDGTPASGGGQWANLSANLPLASTRPFDNFNCQGGYDLCIRVQPGNSNVIIIGGTNLYRNTDGFNSIASNTQIGGYGVATELPFFEIYKNHHPDQHEIYFSRNNPNIMYSISDGGVRRTKNILDKTVSWSDISWGYVTSQCYTVNIDEKNAGDKRMMVGLQDNGNYVSLTDNQKQEWRMPVNGDGAFGYISPDEDFYVTSIQLGRLVKMKLDERGNIVRRRRIDPDTKTTADYSFINPFAVDPNDENIVYLPIGRKLYRMDNLKDIAINNAYNKLAGSWTELSDSISTPNFSSNGNVTTSKISCLAISKSPANVVYVGTNNKEVWRIDNANSANPTWTRTNIDRLQTNANINDIAIDPDDANKVIVCYSNYGRHGLFYSEDGGGNWYYAAGRLARADSNITGASPSIRSVAILKQPNGIRRFFAGTSIGLFSSEVSINTITPSIPVCNTDWQQEAPGLIGANIVTDIKVRQSDGFVAAATHGNGVFESYYTSTKNPTTSAPTIISNSIFPNPANNVLNYSFATGGDANVSILLYNMNGQSLLKKSLGLHTKGSFNYSQDVSSLSAGWYLLGVINEDSGQGGFQKIIISR